MYSRRNLSPTGRSGGGNSTSDRNARRVISVEPPNTRVIVLSGLTDDDLEQRAADAGASACLTKGAADREVVDTIVAVYDGRLNL